MGSHLGISSHAGVYEESQKVAFSTRPAQKVNVSSALLHTLAAASLCHRNQNVAPDLHLLPLHRHRRRSRRSPPLEAVDSQGKCATAQRIFTFPL